MKKKYIAVIAIALIGGGYYWYSKTHSVVQAVRYKTEVAEKETLTFSVSGSGNITVDQVANVDPTITGTVANLAVNIGDSVKKDQLLFDIVNDDLSVTVAKSTASLQQSQNSIDSAELQVKQAKADEAAADDETSTYRQRQILKEKIDIARQGVAAAQKSYNATRSDYNNQLANGAKRKVMSPIDGTVNAINIKNGDDLSRISSGNNAQAAMIIGDLSTLKAKVQVNEVDIPNVIIGQKAMLKFSAVDGLTLTGKVEKMDSLGTVTQGVVIYNVTIGFDSLDPRIKPEMSVSAAIITQVKQDVITVSNSAVKSQNGSSYVEVLKDGAAIPQQVSVEVGLANNTDTEIVSGLNVGDKIVTQTINPNTTGSTTTGGNSSVKLPGLGGGSRGFGG